MLGEVALVDGDSRVGSGLVFLEYALRRERERYIAYGGILDAIADGADKSEAELEEPASTPLRSTQTS